VGFASVVYVVYHGRGIRIPHLVRLNLVRVAKHQCMHEAIVGVCIVRSWPQELRSDVFQGTVVFLWLP
jgi:hypothetical protein